MRYVISLSTIPPRFDKLGPALRSLVSQSLRPVAVELWIPHAYRRFPDWDGRLPQVPEGVTIRRADQDYGPATKVLPAARDWQGKGVELLFCDDDHFFAPDWAAQVQRVRAEQPKAVLCGMVYSLNALRHLPASARRQPQVVNAPYFQHQLGYQLRRMASRLIPHPKDAPNLRQKHRKIDRAGYADILAGCGGVALQPEFLDDPVFDMPPVVWAVDDVWLSGHMERRGIPIWGDPRLNQARAIVATERTAALMHAEIEGADRSVAHRACVDHMRATYGIWGGTASHST